MTYEELMNFIKKRKSTLISVVDSNGFPNIKAMMLPRKIENNIFYFSTNTSSQSVAFYEENPKASIYFFEKGTFNYEGVMLIGEMEVCYDQKTKDEIWQFGDKIYYKNGVTDPDYCVLKFTARKGRHYKNFKKETFDIK